jgi:long-chain acyl-CoA synthetase
MTQRIPATLDAVVTLGDLLRFHGRARSHQEALWFEERSTSYGEFDTLTNRVANALLEEGIGKGARVAFMDKNSDHFYQVVFGCAKAGAVSVGINWRLAPPEVAYIVNDSGAEILFVGPDFYGLVDRIRSEIPTVKRIVAMAPGHPQWTVLHRLA